MDFNYYRELLRKYRDGTCSGEEKQKLDNWYEHLRLDGHLAEDKSEEKTGLAEKSWLDLLERNRELREHLYHTEPLEIRVPGRRRLLPLLVAAGLSVILVAFGLFFYERSNRTESASERVAMHETTDELSLEQAPEKGSRLIILSDGSRVTLVDGGVLRYKYGFDIDKRVVFLQGQAYFEVAENKEKPFYVYANDVVTKVLGTSFLVKASEENREVEVSVTKGKVSVYKADTRAFEITREEPVILLPQQQVSYSPAAGKMMRSDIAAPDELIPTERPDRLIFEKAPLPAILEAVQSAYNVRFEFDRERFSSCTLTTSLEYETLEEMLVIIGRLLDVEYVVSGTTIFLAGKGC